MKNKLGFICLLPLISSCSSLELKKLLPLPFTQREISGTVLLEGPTVIETDKLVFRNSSQIITRGYPLSIKVGRLSVDGEAKISGLTESEKSSCVNVVLPRPQASASGRSYYPGPDAPDHAPAGFAGDSGGAGQPGARGHVGQPCKAPSVSDVELFVSGDAEGKLNVDLGGAVGATGNPSGNGGDGGRGQQGGRCPPGIRGWPGGQGGEGGQGGPALSSASPSGNGGTLKITILGNSDDFELGRIDLGAGEAGAPGLPGHGGSGGQGGHFGRGGSGCVGLENVVAADGHAGFNGQVSFQSVGNLGAEGDLLTKGVSYHTPSEECEDSGDPDPDSAWLATRNFWRTISQQIFLTAADDVPSKRPGQTSLVIRHGEISRLLGISITDPFRGPIEQQIFLNLTAPYPDPAPLSGCASPLNPDTWNCCSTTLNDGTRVQSPFLACLTKPERQTATGSPLQLAALAALTLRTLSRELARTAVLGPKEILSNSSLEPRTIYIELKGPEADQLWPSQRVLLLPLNAALFEKVAILLSTAAPAFGVHFGVPPPSTIFEPGSTSEQHFALLCIGPTVMPIVIGSSSIDRPREGFDQIAVSSSSVIDFIRPKAWPAVEPARSELTLWSYRAQSVQRSKLVPTSHPDHDNSINACKFIATIDWRKDLFAACSRAPLSFSSLSGDYLRVKELRAIVFNYLYIATFGQYLGSKHHKTNWTDDE